jgi:hypothetical protein
MEAIKSRKYSFKPMQEDKFIWKYQKAVTIVSDSKALIENIWVWLIDKTRENIELKNDIVYYLLVAALN